MVMTKSELQTQLLEIFQQIEQTGEEVIVTENEQPVIRIEPIGAKDIQKNGLQKRLTVEEAFGEWRGKVIFHEDPDTPTIDEWDEV